MENVMSKHVKPMARTKHKIVTSSAPVAALEASAQNASGSSNLLPSRYRDVNTYQTVLDSINSGIAGLSQFTAEFAKVLENVLEPKSRGQWLNTISIERPRYVRKVSGSQCRHYEVELAKIHDKLWSAKSIIASYQKKIDKIKKQLMELDDNDKQDKKRKDCVDSYCNSVNFAVFLAFKLFKFEVLEYFIYVRDHIGFDSEIWRVVNLRQVYRVVHETVVYFEYCSIVISLCKDGVVSFDSSTAAAATNTSTNTTTIDSSSDSSTSSSSSSSSSISSTTTSTGSKSTSTKLSTVLTPAQLIQQFPSRLSRFKTTLNNLSSLITQLRAQDLKKSPTENYTEYVSLLYHQQPVYERFVTSITNFHIRYLKLILKFVEDNKDSRFFEVNLLPVGDNSNDPGVKRKFGSLGSNETLIKLIKARISRNITQLVEVVGSLDEIYTRADQKESSGDKLKVLRELPNIIYQSHKTLNDSFDFISSIIPLFPKDLTGKYRGWRYSSNAGHVASLNRRMVNLHQNKITKPSLRFVGNPSGSRSRRVRIPIAACSTTDTTHLSRPKKSHAASYEYLDNESFLNIAWFIPVDLKKKFDGLANEFARFDVVLGEKEGAGVDIIEDLNEEIESWGELMDEEDIGMGLVVY